MKKIYYYKNFNEDLVKSNNQQYKLPDNYKWIKTNRIYKIGSGILYGIAYVFSFFYSKFYLGVKIENRKVLKKYKNQGYFLYGNHTQPVGDVFMPTQVCKKRIYTVASPSNMGVKIIGPLLPSLGILPIPESKTQMKEFINAVKERVNQNHAIIIYPEAHVWPYYTKIRPFPDTSFKFPVDTGTPVFCMTTTYYKGKRKRPKIKIYVDGPFEVDKNLSKKENQKKLCKDVWECMEKRSQNSNYEYIEYKSKQEK